MTIRAMAIFKQPTVFYLLAAIIAIFAPLPTSNAVDEQDIIQNLAANRHLINRTVTETQDGIIASTWSLEENVSGWLKTHVQQMKALIESDTGTIRQWDDLFYEAFALRDFHHMNVNYTDNGVEVEQIGENDCAKAIVQAHAAVVSLFIERGQDEIRLNHEVPTECSPSVTSAGSTSSSMIYKKLHVFISFGAFVATLMLIK